MHPILFRLPLPHMPLKLWWALAAVAVIAAVYAILGLRRQDRGTALGAFVVGIGAIAAAYVWRTTQFESPNLPIYSYGVMLGLSLVVGWYLTLTLAERDGLPKETMANCYVVTALAAIVGSRLLYIVTNLDEFRANVHDPNSDLVFSSFFALRRGGLVAYGGFLGGFLGSWLFLERHKLRLMPWADVAVPSLASGLFITRIGCYLFGCDFGKRLSPTAPGFLQSLGTFPHWGSGTLDGGDGAPAFTKHLDAAGHGTPAAAELLKMNHSFPVHPTQIYESLTGLALLALLLWQRKHQKFRGQIFFLFAFAYGYARFLIEMLRDDSERGEFGTFPEHLFISGALFLLALAFTFGISLGITNPKARTVARVASFVPAIAAYLILRPASFAAVVQAHPSTSQWIGLLSALVVAYFYARFWESARRSPKLAMGLESLGDIKPTADDAGPRRRARDEEDEEEDEAEAGEAEPRRKKAKTKVASNAKPAAAEDDASEDDGDGEGDEPDGETQKAG
ncbi:Prolipoprotein diacylglyceryl transferase [Labilithrix luteola]|uniref:Phosphatidylglycerol--prolipoprotein diacylglyceryl transferase n=1 Tax=Labilithrix luteola TaxID=1391654 RepID=A0A0K1PSD3_9BACT|nr:prolipoprotein diacylglyceryl transferase family protein [Labilithrix luteola]AKU96266.1 Prolipoprotein diacylglyceryl transferase [Labilithrix luteola]